MGSVLWWGRCDPNYTRNKIIAKLFQDLNWKISYYHPIASQIGLIQAYFSSLKKPDFIWVPCFRQRDMFSAIYWAKKWQIPLIFEPLTSAYEKEVYERKKWAPGSFMAEKKRYWESKLFLSADVVVLENYAYADFVNKEMNIPKKKLGILYQGAYTDFFREMPWIAPSPIFEIVFVGSFHPSMGTDVIVEAARLSQKLPCRFTLIGEGDLKADALKKAKGLNNVTFEPWIEHSKLPERLSRAHILLGIFGSTFKTDFVIPNKVFESMAMARPLITQTATAYNTNIGNSDVIGWVRKNDPQSLADKINEWVKNQEHLEQRGMETRKIFDKFFGPAKQKQMLQEILAKISL